MAQFNISDIIEKHLKTLIQKEKQIEIKRSEIADKFEVVPSQINYVINTRFNLQTGYLVQSKRGGGGYIRIIHIDLSNDAYVFDELINYIGDEINIKNSKNIIESLLEDKLISKRESDIMISVISNDTLKLNDKKLEENIRAKILKAVLQRIRLNF